MNTLSKEQIVEILAFEEKLTDPECPVLTPEQLAQLRPSRHRLIKNKVFMEVPDDDQPVTPVLNADAVLV